MDEPQNIRLSTQEIEDYTLHDCLKFLENTKYVRKQTSGCLVWEVEVGTECSHKGTFGHDSIQSICFCQIN